MGTENKRNWPKSAIRLSVILAAAVLLTAPVARALQDTGKPTAGTGNPQSSAPQPYQQRGNLQTTEPSTLLNQPAPIRIPAGKPLPARRNTNDKSSATWIWAVITVAAAGAVALAAARRRGRKPQPADDELPAAAPERPKARTKKQPRSKRKKSRR